MRVPRLERGSLIVLTGRMKNTTLTKNRFGIPLNRPNKMRRRASRIFLALTSIGMICAICFAPAAFAQVRYHVTRIPAAQGANSVALGINNKGEVVGYSFQGEDYQAFVYSSSDQRFTDVGRWAVRSMRRAPSMRPEKS